MQNITPVKGVARNISDFSQDGQGKTVKKPSSREYEQREHLAVNCT
jgi:hypothetical protein